MGRMVTCSLRDTTRCIYRYQEKLADIPKLIQNFEKSAARLMERTGADHVLYACKIYNADDSLVAVQFYEQPMDDETFYRITGKVRGALIYALHNRRKQSV